MTQTSTLTIQLADESMNRLEMLSRETSNSSADLATKAVEQYLDVQEWQIQAIQEAVKKADSPNAQFLDHEDVVKLMKGAGKL